MIQSSGSCWCFIGKNFPENQYAKALLLVLKINQTKGRPIRTTFFDPLFYFQVPLIVLGVFGANLPSLLRYFHERTRHGFPTASLLRMSLSPQSQARWPYYRQSSLLDSPSHSPPAIRCCNRNRLAKFWTRIARFGISRMSWRLSDTCQTEHAVVPNRNRRRLVMYGQNL